MSFKVKIKPTTGGDNIIVETRDSATVADLKQAISTTASIPEGEQRLIYKGQVLKNERTVESYGIKADHVLHMVRSKPPSSTTNSTPSGQPAATPAPNARASPLTPSAPGLQVPGMAGQEQMIASMMQNPQVQAMLNNPEVLRGILQSNPAMRQLLDQHPELNHALNNPQILRETMQMLSNPSLAREHSRNTDRVLSNIEAHPEGFNALRRMYADIQAPLENATTGENSTAAGNPFAGLFQGQNTGTQNGSTAGSTQTGNNASENASSTAPSATPNSAPLPNPWAPNAGSGAAGQTAGTTPPSLPGMPGLGDLGNLGNLNLPGGLPGAPQGAAGLPVARQMLGDPQFQSFMNSMLSSDQGQALMRGIAERNPQFRAMMDANPALREAMNDPEQLRRMLSPEAMTAAVNLNEQIQNLNLGAGGQADPNAFGNFLQSQGGAGGNQGLNDLSFLNLFGSQGQNPARPVANPEEAFAEQLSQLDAMGFWDREANIRALQQTQGNVQAAVDRLLATPP